MRCALLAAILVGLIGWSIDEASAWTPYAWQASIGIARAAWPDSPCSGNEQIEVIDDLPVPGRAYLDGSCTVALAPADPANLVAGFTLCNDLVHEFGHLAGRTHDDIYDHDGIMAAGYGGIYTPCRVLLPWPPALARAEAASTFSISPNRCRLETVSAGGRRIYRCGRYARVAIRMHDGLVQAADLLTPATKPLRLPGT